LNWSYNYYEEDLIVPDLGFDVNFQNRLIQNFRDHCLGQQTCRLKIDDKVMPQECLDKVGKTYDYNNATDMT